MQLLPKNRGQRRLFHHEIDMTLSLLSFPPYLGRIGMRFETLPINMFVMKALFRILFAGVLLLSVQQAAAQSLIFYQNTRTEAYLVKQHGGGPSEGVIDHFIERLAISSGKPVTRTEFIIAHDEYVRLTKVNTTQYDVYVTLGNMRLTGDTQYRGFSMANELIPTGVKFNLERVSKTGQVLERFPFDNVDLTGAETIVANFRGSDTTGLFTEQTVRLGDKQFIYVKEAKGKFDQRTILIDDYYASIPKMETLNIDFKKINPDDFEHIDVQQNDLNQLIVRLNTISSSNFPENLSLSQSDPAGYNVRFQALNALAQDLNARIQKTKAEMPERYYQRGLAYVQQNKPAEASADFTLAVKLKPTLAPAHLELARLRYREGDVAGATGRLLTIFKDCQPDEVTRQAATQLGTTIYQNHITNADYAIKQKKYVTGLRSLSEARSVCTELKLTCTAQLDDLSSLAHGGIYQGKVDTARLALQANKFEEAEVEATKALDYQKANATFVKDPSAALRVQADAQTRIYQRMLTTANALADQGKLTEAEAEARKALDYQASHSAAIAQPMAAQQALDRVMGLRYTDNVVRAKALQAQIQHRQALQLLDEAVVIETKFQVSKDPNLWNLVLASAKPVLLEDAANGQQLAKSNKLVEARNLTNATKALVIQYKLQNDPEVSKAVEAMSGAIFSQECTNAQGEFDAGVNDAEVQQRLKKFIEARAAYDRALKVAADQAVCGIDSRRATEGKTAIATAAKYQEMLLEAQAAVDRNDSKTAIETYLKAGELALSENLGGRFGLQHAPLYDFISGSGKLEFIRFGAGYFTEKKDFEPALGLLHKSVQMGVPTGMIKDLMKRLGAELGIRDRQTEPGSDPKAKAAEYTKGNSKLKTLAKAYLKQRK